MYVCRDVFGSGSGRKKRDAGLNGNKIYVLLTAHLSIFILVINQLDAQDLFCNKYISCLYMFRESCAHRQEVKNCITQPLVSSHLGIITPIGVMIPEAV